MFSRIVISALFAGAAAGLIAAVLQLVFVQPLLLQAELYEAGELVHSGAAAATAPTAAGIDPARSAFTVLFVMLVHTGFALVMVALMSQAERQGHAVNGRVGLLWGIGGFVAVQLAPGLSLPPEVPGVATADLTARQIWWTGTVAAAGVSVWLIAFGRGWAMWGLAVALLLVPHLIGAPMAEVFAGPAPPELASLFTARALGVGLAGWALTGCFSGFFWCREGERAT